MIINKVITTDTDRQYTEAYKEHYISKDLHAALQLYNDIVVSFPDSKEAEYSRSQIENIIRDVIPQEVLYSTQLSMALNYAKSNSSSNKRPVEITV